MNSKFLLLVLMGIFFSHISYTQVPKSEDSLVIFLRKHSQNDTLYLWGMRPYALILMYEKSNLRKADSLANQMKVVSEKINYGRGFYYYYLIKAIIGQQKSDHQTMLENFQKCLAMVDKYSLHPSMKEASLNNIAMSYGALGNKHETMNYALQAIEVQEKNKLRNMDDAPYQAVGDVLMYNKRYKEALLYYEKSLAIAKKKENYIGMGITENKIGSTYDEIGKQAEALKHYKIGYQYALKSKYLLLQADLLNNLGSMEMYFKNYEAAEKYLLENDRLCKEVENEQSLQENCIEIGNLYKIQKKYLIAEKYFLQAKFLNNNNKNPIITQKVAENLSEFYAETHNIGKAYKYLLEANVARDSASKIESEKLTQELLTKYETEKKETQIKLLSEQAKADDFQKSAYLGVGVLAVLLGGLLIFSLQNRNKLKQLQDSQRLRNKISSDLHDEIGSTLSSISLLSGMTEEKLRKNDSSKVKQMVHRIHQDSQQVMESIDDIIWTVNPKNDSLTQMILRLKDFAAPLAESKNIQLNFQSPLDINSVALSMEIRRNIYLITKEAINNLVKYSNASFASITFQKEGNILDIQIVDNGKGFNTEVLSDRNGVRNMQERAKEMKAQIEIQSSENEGTKIFLKVPIV